jgi:hypothetical protein
MNLTTIPFSEIENKKKYTISTFIEDGLKINILNEVTKYHKIPSGNFYKFGAIINGEYFWYFRATPVANDREQMREIFSAIINITDFSTTTPFIYKVKKIW